MNITFPVPHDINDVDNEGKQDDPEHDGEDIPPEYELLYSIHGAQMRVTIVFPFMGHQERQAEDVEQYDENNIEHMKRRPVALSRPEKLRNTDHRCEKQHKINVGDHLYGEVGMAGINSVRP
jgi:hypothetical protein